MFRKRKKLKEDFKVVFAHYSPEEQVELGASLMLDVYLNNPDRLYRAMGDIEVARLAKRTKELIAQARALGDSMDSTMFIIDKIKESYESTDAGGETPKHPGKGS